VLIDNDGTDPVVGTFEGFAEGQVVAFAGGRGFGRVSYRGGDGNDVVLTVLPPRVERMAVAPGPGGGPLVKVYHGAGGLRLNILAYDGAFRGGVRVATGDVTGDGIEDVVTAPGPGGGPHVRVFDGRTGAAVFDLFPYAAGFRGGVTVALGDVDADGFADIVTGAGAGGGPHVRVFSGLTGQVLQDFFAYEQTFLGGVYVAAGDVTGDGRVDVVTGTGVGGGPLVKTFDFHPGLFPPFNLYAYEESFRGGVTVAVGDLDGDGVAEIVTGTGEGGGPLVRAFRIFDGGGIRLSGFAYAQSFRGGVAVAVTDSDGDGRAEIVTGPGPGGGPHVRILSGDDLSERAAFLAFDPAFLGGVSVG
jgi:hypothetical protein